MDVPKGHPQGADPRAFLEDAELLIQKKLEEELKALKGGLKFQLALKVDLEKANPDGSEEYTDPVLRHIPKGAGNPWKVDPKRIWLGCRSGSHPLARHRQISASPGWILHPTTSGSEKQEGSGEC